MVSFLAETHQLSCKEGVANQWLENSLSQLLPMARELKDRINRLSLIIKNEA